MLATLLDRDPFLGRILTGWIESGKLTTNMRFLTRSPRQPAR